MEMGNCYHTPSKVDCRGPYHCRNTAMRCNLVQNPGFEANLSGWATNNVVTTNYKPLEGTASARMGSGFASMFQDVSLTGISNKALLLIFEVVATAPEGGSKFSDMIVEVLWLDMAGNEIGRGLRVLLPNAGSYSRSIFLNVTDRSPKNATKARLLFSKQEDLTTPNFLDIDHIVLTPADSINLLQNPGFQSGLMNWNASEVIPGSLPFEGTSEALFDENGTLYQDVDITRKTRFPFLLSFTVFGEGSLNAKVIWLDGLNNPIASPGLSLFIPSLTFNAYLPCLAVTKPAPVNAVKARVLFTSSTAIGTRVHFDNVMLIPVQSANLIQNPSFESGLIDWNSFQTSIITPDPNNAYEQEKYAKMGTSGFLIQDVSLDRQGCCYLFSFGCRSTSGYSNLLAEVRWLDVKGNEIGLGLNLIVTERSSSWIPYYGVTEPAPPGAVRAKVLFSLQGGIIELDQIVFTCLSSCASTC